jgi:NitT/TauT family transport system permease protein
MVTTRRAPWIPDALAPWITVAMLIAIWQLAVRAADLPTHLFPTPGMVGARLASGFVTFGDLWPHLGATLRSAALGAVLAAVVAWGTALALALLPWAERLFTAPLTTVQAVPKVSLAPLMLIWIGFNRTSVVVLVALVCFFPLFAHALQAFKATSAALADLYAVHRAGFARRLLDLLLPGAARGLFAGLQLAVGFSLVGAVVMELILGSEGIGFLIDNSANTLDVATAVAAMVAVGVAGALISALLRRVERAVVFWEGLR